MFEELRHHREVHVANHKIREKRPCRRHDLGEDAGNDEADDEQVQETYVLMDDDPIQDVLND